VAEKLLINNITIDEFRQLLNELIIESKESFEIPDFEISILQTQKILGVTYPTIKSYMEEGYLVNISKDGRRAKFNFYNVLELRKTNIRYKRFRNLNP